MPEGDSTIGRSPADQEFRKTMISMIDSAQHEIVIITGEFHLYETFLDVRWAVNDALKRGVTIRIFLKGPHKIVEHNLVKNGAEVYVEPNADLKDHFMSIDGRAYMVSFTHSPFGIGDRTALYNWNAPEKAKEIEDDFKKLTENLPRATGTAPDRNPLLDLYSEPIDLGYPTDASRLDEELP